MHAPSDVRGEIQKLKRHFEGEKSSKNDGEINYTSTKINECLSLTKVLLEIPFDAPYDLWQYIYIPSPLIYDSELLDFLRTEEFWNDFTMAKLKVCFKEDKLHLSHKPKKGLISPEKLSYKFTCTISGRQRLMNLLGKNILNPSSDRENQVTNRILILNCCRKQEFKIFLFFH